MNGLYQMLLFLFIVGAVTQGMNEIGVFDIAIPDQGITTTEATVTDLQAGAQSASTETGTWEILMSFMAVIGAGILAMFTIVPMIIDWGAMAGADSGTMLILATILQAPVTVVTLFGLYEFWLGRSVT